ncbi:MAG: malto-oligosyltrehalose trehalohydrolase [Thermoanaerobaculia bacterium]|nr:malto-oligosyltrehalose trehalohydrolase [Thermoanaerobaculia bacterium]
MTNSSAPTRPFGLPLGAILDGERCEFRVWAPARKSVEVKLLGGNERRIPMTKTADGYHEATVNNCPAGTRYIFVLDGNVERADPASRLQPDGVHKASEVVSREFAWTDSKWRGIPLEEHVIYEMHVGTFTPEGAFDAVIGRLDQLKDLGVNAIELLPIAQFPGTRNWGYDGVYVGAAQNSYGGPLGLKRLADAGHARGMALLLDVVYNHLGPEGNYLSEFGPYFTDRYKTPWGLALNFDGAHSDHVRWFFIHNALQWIDEFHIDGLRVDAVHAIVDHTAEPFLQDLCTAVRERASKLGRKVWTIAESDLNDVRVITPPEKLGLGFDSQWNDDFHHSLHTLLTGESDGYYAGYGTVGHLARVFESGYYFQGQSSLYRNRRYGSKPNTKDGSKFVVCAQNHDQVGNRAIGDRLAASVSPEKLRIAAAAVVLAPFVPMLFMGEEYGEKAPFLYFTSHEDKDLIEAVRKGRLEEFDDFEWKGEPPDPNHEKSFQDSRLDWNLLGEKDHASLRALYKELLALRRGTPDLRTLDLSAVATHADEERKVLLVRRASILIAFNFGDGAQHIDIPFKGTWKPLIASDASIDKQLLSIPPGFAVFSG